MSTSKKEAILIEVNREYHTNEENPIVNQAWYKMIAAAQKTGKTADCLALGKEYYMNNRTVDENGTVVPKNPKGDQ